MAQFSGKYLQVSFPLKWSIPLGLILHVHTQNASPTTSSKAFLWRRPKVDLKARPLLTHPGYLVQFLNMLIQKRSLKAKAPWWANRSVNVCNVIFYAELTERNSLFDISTQNKLSASCGTVNSPAVKSCTWVRSCALGVDSLMSASPDRLLGFTAAYFCAASRLLPKLGHAGESVSSLRSASALFLQPRCCATAAVKEAWLWLISREGFDVKSPRTLQVSFECVFDFWCHQSVEWIKR